MKESKDIKRRLEEMDGILCGEIYEIFEKRNATEEITINVVINNSHYTAIEATPDRYGVALSIKEEEYENDGTIRIYYNEPDALSTSALIEIYKAILNALD